MLAEREVLLEQVDHARHLEVDQAAVALGLELRKERVELGELARVEDELLELRDLHRGQRELRLVGCVEHALRREARQGVLELADRRGRLAQRCGHAIDGVVEVLVEALCLGFVRERAVAADGRDGGRDSRVVVEAGIRVGQAGRAAVVLLDFGEGSEAEGAPGRVARKGVGLRRDVKVERECSGFVLVASAAGVDRA